MFPENRKVIMLPHTSKLDTIRKLALEAGMLEPKIINVNSIVLGEWVRWKCKYGCPDYGQWLTCPPYSPTPSQTQTLLQEYSRALLFQMKPTQGYTGTHRVGRLYKNLAELERKIFLSGYRKALAFGGGECDLCQRCSLKTGVCRKPEYARPSMEACGIDVFATAHKAGYPRRILNTRNELFTWIGLILIE